MKREGLDNLITNIHRNFTAVSCTVRTFRDLELDDMETDGLKRDEAAKVYDERVKKLNFLVEKLGQFSQETPDELQDATVVIIIQALINRIKSVLEISTDNANIRKAWINTALRSTNLSLAARNSFASILEFIKENKLAYGLEPKHKEFLVKIMVIENKPPYGIGTYSKASGFGGFISPAIPKPQPATAVTANDNEKLTKLYPKPPKIVFRKS